MVLRDAARQGAISEVHCTGLTSQRHCSQHRSIRPPGRNVTGIDPALWRWDMVDYKGSCFCGAVEFTVSGEPAAMGYCHCESCRHWSAGPVNAFSLWPPEAVKVTKGANNI